jgi:hypothetical protein
MALKGQTAFGGRDEWFGLVEPADHARKGVSGMNRGPVWRWLLLNEEWPWMNRRPLWQYLLLDWAIWVLAGLIAFAIAIAALRHVPSFSWLIGWVGAGTLVRPVLARRRWRRMHAQVPPASVGTQN